MPRTLQTLPRFSLRPPRFDPFDQLLSSAFRCSESEAQAVTEVIVDGDDNSVLRLQKSRLDLFGNIGLTGTLLATITITSLQLPTLLSIHWLVRAFWTATLVQSLVSAYTSFVMYKALLAVPSTMDIRRFFSGVYVTPGPGRRIPASVTPDFITYYLELPSSFLNSALVFYLLGLGFFWLFNWLGAKSSPDDPDPIGSRNVFIFFLLSLAFCLGMLLLSKATYMLNSVANAKVADRELQDFKAQKLRSLEAQAPPMGGSPDAASATFSRARQGAERRIREGGSLKTASAWNQEIEERLKEIERQQAVM